ncbi:nucleoside phosphorylase [Magnetospirillum fulvum]|uniref:Hopanoid-associated phosphorylase n=1 Tax=Magnetospirillum fulvum TaxID=1082 RepID=A0A1H6JE02_MAGFU|nr:nucleoside phosphorylase [Magnetospirillum fulvum]SEH57271.1 hopanoid-associated phosphorylase [Magnetospirillum fulvum]
MPSDADESASSDSFPAACWLDGVPGRVPVGVIVGMESEAALLPPGTRFGIAGADSARAAAEARRLLDEGAEALLSLGIGGGLDPALAPGEIVVGTAVQDGDETFAVNQVWMCRLLNAIPHSRSGVIHASAGPVVGRGAKQALFAASGARVVDMESGGVARVAAQAGRPFAVIRAVADSADLTLPSSALVGIGPDGKARPLAVLGRLALKPWELPDLIRVGIDSHAAHSSLRAALAGLGTAFGL